MKNKIGERLRKGALATAVSMTMFSANALAADVSVHASIDSTVLWMGEQSLIRLQLAQDKDAEVWLLPTFSETLVPGIEVLEVSRPDTSDLGNGRLQIDRRLLITSFDSGFFYIPPFKYLMGTDTLYTESLSIKILPMEVDTSKAIVDIKAIRKPSSSWLMILWDSIPLFVWILLAVLLIGGGIAFGIYKWWKERKLPETEPETLLPPYEKALLALSRLREEKLWQEGREKEYYTALIDILREYLYGRFGIQAMEMTSAQILEHLRADKAGHEHDRRIRAILEVADFVKFAKMRPLPEDNESVMHNAVAFVESTRPEPEQAPVQENAPAAGEIPTEESRQPDGEPQPKSSPEDDFEKYGPSNKNRR